MDGQLIELAYALDTFYFLVMGAFVMWMAAGFSMLEAGLVRSKSTVEILTKNIALYSIASIMYMLVGYNLMYPADGNGVIPAVNFFLGGDNEAADVIASGGEIYYSALSDFFFQVVFVATAMSIVSGAVAERMKLSSFLLFCIVMTGLIYPIQGYWKWGGGFLDAAGFQDFAGSGVVHLCGAAAAFVFTNTKATALASATFETISSEPPLKPNQPNHKINVPSVAKGILAPGIAFIFPFTYFPFLAPRRKTPASAAAAPHKCTTPDPAKS